MGQPSARLLDLTRLVSRVGRGPLTGVDRVELAYLEAVLADDPPAYALVRTAFGFLLLDQRGVHAVARLARGELSLDHANLFGRLTRRKDPLRARAETTVRKLAMARTAVPGLAAMLRRHLPAGISYLNVGHANLTDRVLRAAKALPQAKVAVLVHDVIPLDYPHYSRPGIADVFARKMMAVSDHADLLICSSADALVRTKAQLAHFGRVPEILVASLGVLLSKPGAMPLQVDVTRPYFVAIGTIEPRKNHALLLDVWQRLADRLPDAAMPDLYIIGARGWANEAVFARLDGGVPHVIELPGLNDGAVAAVLADAQALLFPSHAEGFGLPPYEAATLGVPVFSSDLQVLRDSLGDYPVYLDTADSYSWLETIEKAAKADWAKGGVAAQRREVPNWTEHFNAVLSLV